MAEEADGGERRSDLRREGVKATRGEISRQDLAQIGNFGIGTT
jgi:hypothetical protein